MSDRFYMQMVTATGWAPGYRNTKTIEEYKSRFGSTKRRKSMSWTDEKKQEAIDMYVGEEPTPENSMEIVADIAEQLEESPNGVRMILTKAGVYVRKTPAAKSSGGSGGGRVSVADAQSSLTDALNDAGQEIDSAIISKLTGKAAVYFTSVVNNLNN
jgi:transposase-like protein|tara:strand:- start:411 stop:881 length:471 start_codon:yes stop_codon:yes gene_type:complete